jgi:SHS2 domain-containing protein
VTSAGFELLEHTADVGVRARGATLEAVFEQATLGLAEVLGASRPGRGEPVAVEVAAGDLGGLLVDWLNEVLWLQEVRQAAVAAVRVEHAGDGRAAGADAPSAPGTDATSAPDGGAFSAVGAVAFSAGEPPPKGTFVKAVTYHRLRVERDRDGWLAEVYLDV